MSKEYFEKKAKEWIDKRYGGSLADADGFRYGNSTNIGYLVQLLDEVAKAQREACFQAVYRTPSLEQAILGAEIETPEDDLVIPHIKSSIEVKATYTKGEKIKPKEIESE